MAEKKTTSKKTSKKDVEELQEVNVPQDAEVQEEVKEETPAEEPDGLNVPEQEEEPVTEPKQEPEPENEPESPAEEPEPEPEEKNKNDESLDYEALNEEFKNTDEKIENLLEGAKTPEEVQQVLETEIDRVKGLEEQIAADIKKAEGKVNKKAFRVDDFNDFWNGTSFT